MKWFSYLWSVIIGLVELAIVFSLFNIPNSRFEEVVISALVIIYTTVRTLGGGLALVSTEADNRNVKRFIYLAKATNALVFELEKEELEEQLKESAEENNKFKVKTYIYLAIVSVAYFVALYHLVFSNYIS